jgi:5-methylcytosine-specific restriction enzyme subunit McrC
LVYADVRDVPIANLQWDMAVIDRTNSRWRQLLNFAKMLLGECFQATSSGAMSGFSLLFEMNALFEDYVARMLLRALAGSRLQVIAQGGRRYCLETSEGRRLFQTKPDILVMRDGFVEQVIDTKWKRLGRRADDPKQGIGQTDVYQMMAYGQLYKCRKLALLYPHYQALGEATMKATHRVAVEGRDDELQVATINLSSNSATSDQLRELFGDI